MLQVRLEKSSSGKLRKTLTKLEDDAAWGNAAVTVEMRIIVKLTL